MSTSQTFSTRARPTLRFRLLGVLPLLFFLARVVEYVVVAGTPEQILWSCHISNLLLAIGLFWVKPWLIRVAVFWLILGVPPWVIDMMVSRLVTPISIFSHLGGGVMAIVAIKQVRARGGSWLPSLIYFLVLQQLTRLVTVPGPYTNVNVAHFAYGPWQGLFDNYWKYWVVNTALAAITLWAIDWALTKIFPPLAR